MLPAAVRSKKVKSSRVRSGAAASNGFLQTSFPSSISSSKLLNCNVHRTKGASRHPKSSSNEVPKEVPKGVEMNLKRGPKGANLRDQNIASGGCQKQKSEIRQGSARNDPEQWFPPDLLPFFNLILFHPNRNVHRTKGASRHQAQKKSQKGSK